VAVGLLVLGWLLLSAGHLTLFLGVGLFVLWLFVYGCFVGWAVAWLVWLTVIYGWTSYPVP
jgi:hypothetical protein